MAVERFPTNNELAYEAARKEGFGGDSRQGLFEKPVETSTPYALEDNDTSAYLGTDPSYMTYANKTDQPLRAKSGAEKAVEEEVYDTPTQFGSLYAPAMDDPRQLALDAKAKNESDKVEATKAAVESDKKTENQQVAQTAAPVAETNKANTTSTPPAPKK